MEVVEIYKWHIRSEFCPRTLHFERKTTQIKTRNIFKKKTTFILVWIIIFFGLHDRLLRLKTLLLSCSRNRCLLWNRSNQRINNNQLLDLDELIPGSSILLRLILRKIKRKYIHPQLSTQLRGGIPQWWRHRQPNNSHTHWPHTTLTSLPPLEDTEDKFWLICRKHYPLRTFPNLFCVFEFSCAGWGPAIYHPKNIQKCLFCLLFYNFLTANWNSSDSWRRISDRFKGLFSLEVWCLFKCVANFNSLTTRVFGNEHRASFSCASIFILFLLLFS